MKLKKMIAMLVVLLFAAGVIFMACGDSDDDDGDQYTCENACAKLEECGLLEITGTADYNSCVQGCKEAGVEDSDTLKCIIDSSCEEIPVVCLGAPCYDADADGYYDKAGCGTEVDCDDFDASVNPGASEVCDDGIDNDCDGYTDGEDSDCGGGGSGSNTPSMSELTSGTPTAQVNQSNVSGLVADLDAGAMITSAQAGVCTEIEAGVDSSAICPDGGSVSVQDCTASSETDFSYDMVFTDCTTTEGGYEVTMNGTISVDADAPFYDVTYDNFESEVSGYPSSTLNMTIHMYVTGSGDAVTYTISGSDVTVNGMDASSMPCSAVVTVDTSAQEWTSDGGCGLPTGPISY